MYAIKVYLKKPRASGLKTKGNYFLSSDLDRNFYLMRDMNDNIVHIYTDKQKAQNVADQLQLRNSKSLITITSDIPASALSRGLQKLGIKNENS
jgi:hypothetical protein